MLRRGLVEHVHDVGGVFLPGPCQGRPALGGRYPSNTANNTHIGRSPIVYVSRGDNLPVV